MKGQAKGGAEQDLMPPPRSVPARRQERDRAAEAVVAAGFGTNNVATMQRLDRSRSPSRLEDWTRMQSRRNPACCYHWNPQTGETLTQAEFVSRFGMVASDSSRLQQQVLQQQHEIGQLTQHMKRGQQHPSNIPGTQLMSGAGAASSSVVSRVQLVSGSCASGSWDWI